MNTRKSHLFVALAAFFVFFPATFTLAQKSSAREIIQRAMREEMQRNIQRLQMENLQRPFFISYAIRDVKTMAVAATLGALVSSDEDHFRRHSVRVMVGDYHRTDENFQAGGTWRQTLLQGADALPIEDDYNGIRRALWIATDNVYKRASEIYERKKAALEQQTLTEEEKALDDFAKAPVLKFSEPPQTFVMQRAAWEKTAKELSAVFRNFPDIYASQVQVYFYQAEVYFLNSEGTETQHPLTLAMVQINASTQAAGDGEPLADHELFYANVPEDLPTLEVMKKAATTMAEDLAALRNAPVFEDSYSGPVMFADQAAAELVAQRLFTGTSGLLAHRRPLRMRSEHPAEHPSEHPGQRSFEETLEDKINTRIISKDLTIKATPKLQAFAGQKLIGAYQVDEEGFKPPDEIVLVENGTLKTLLSNRIPTKAVRESNGHQRPVIGTGAGSSLGPSVIAVNTIAGKSPAEMKRQLLEMAKAEGLEYTVLVRKIKSPASGSEGRVDPMAFFAMARAGQDGASLSEPILLYRVWVKDGREELVRSVKLGSLPLSSLRRMASASQEHKVYNTLVASGGGFFMMGPAFSVSGIPASFIVPQALIFEELEVKKEQREFTPKLPVVPSPLTRK
jgi:hypothetical protein